MTAKCYRFYLTILFWLGIGCIIAGLILAVNSFLPNEEKVKPPKITSMTRTVDSEELKELKNRLVELEIQVQILAEEHVLLFEALKRSQKDARIHYDFR